MCIHIWAVKNFIAFLYKKLHLPDLWNKWYNLYCDYQKIQIEKRYEP